MKKIIYLLILIALPIVFYTLNNKGLINIKGLSLNENLDKQSISATEGTPINYRYDCWITTGGYYTCGMVEDTASSTASTTLTGVQVNTSTTTPATSTPSSGQNSQPIITLTQAQNVIARTELNRLTKSFNPGCKVNPSTDGTKLTLNASYQGTSPVRPIKYTWTANGLSIPAGSAQVDMTSFKPGSTYTATVKATGVFNVGGRLVEIESKEQKCSARIPKIRPVCTGKLSEEGDGIVWTVTAGSIPESDMKYRWKDRSTASTSKTQIVVTRGKIDKAKNNNSVTVSHSDVMPNAVNCSLPAYIYETPVPTKPSPNPNLKACKPDHVPFDSVNSYHKKMVSFANNVPDERLEITAKQEVGAHAVVFSEGNVCAKFYDGVSFNPNDNIPFDVNRPQWDDVGTVGNFFALYDNEEGIIQRKVEHTYDVKSNLNSSNIAFRNIKGVSVILPSFGNLVNSLNIDEAFKAKYLFTHGIVGPYNIGAHYSLSRPTVLLEPGAKLINLEISFDLVDEITKISEDAYRRKGRNSQGQAYVENELIKIYSKNPGVNAKIQKFIINQ